MSDRDVDALAEVLRGSRLSWGTHSDRWTDTEWQAEFWREAATLALNWLASRPIPCPVCNGAGIVDTSPPGVEGSAP